MKKQLKHTYNKFNNVIKKFKNKMEKWLEKLQDKIDKWIKKLNNKIEKLQEKKDKWIKKFKNKMKNWCRKQNNSKDKKENIGFEENEIINAIKKYRNRIEQFKIEDDRKQEIKFIKLKLKIGNVLLKGKKGSGKTAIAKATAKSLKIKFFEINLMNISVSDVNNNKILKYLNWKGKLSYFTKLESFYKIIDKLFLWIPSLIMIISTFLSSFLLQEKYLLFFLIMPFIFWLISPIIFKIFFKKKQIILISEINFLKEEKFKNIKEILLKITNLYKNDYIIFESTNSIPEYLIDKYCISVLKVNNNSNFKMPIEQAIETIEEWVNNYKKNKVIKSFWKYEYKNIETVKNDIWKIIEYFSFREIKILGEEIVLNYIYFKGEINIWNYINVFYLRKKNKKLLNELIKIDIEKYKEKNNIYYNKINFKKIIKELEIKEIIKENDHILKRIIENIYSFYDFPFDMFYSKLQERKFLFSEKKHQFKYINIFKNNNKYNEILNLFFNEPIKFVLEIKKRKINYQELNNDIKYINDIDCIKFVEEIIEGDINKYSKEKQRIFLEEINLSLNLIYFSRKNSVTFYESLSSEKLKFIFLRFYSESKNKEEVKELIKNNFKKQSKELFVKNIHLSYYVKTNMLQKIKLFEIEDYLEFLIKEKCNVQIVCMFDNSNIILNNTNKEFYFLSSVFLSKKLIEVIKQIILNFDKKANIFYSDENKNIHHYNYDETMLTSEDVNEIEDTIKTKILSYQENTKNSLIKITSNN